jgi:hypothetical protein
MSDRIFNSDIPVIQRIEVIDEMKVFKYEKLDSLMKENNEILAIMVASIRTAKKK